MFLQIRLGQGCDSRMFIVGINLQGKPDEGKIHTVRSLFLHVVAAILQKWPEKLGVLTTSLRTKVLKSTPPVPRAGRMVLY